MQQGARLPVYKGEKCILAEPWELTPKQRIVFECLKTTMVTKDIANALGHSESASKQLIHLVYQRLNIKGGRKQFWLRYGLEGVRVVCEEPELQTVA